MLHHSLLSMQSGQIQGNGRYRRLDGIKNEEKSGKCGRYRYPGGVWKIEKDNIGNIGKGTKGNLKYKNLKKLRNIK